MVTGAFVAGVTGLTSGTVVVVVVVVVVDSVVEEVFGCNSCLQQTWVSPLLKLGQKYSKLPSISIPFILSPISAMSMISEIGSVHWSLLIH